MSNTKKLKGRKLGRRLDSHRARQSEAQILSGGNSNPPYGRAPIVNRAEPLLDAPIPQKSRKKPPKNYWCPARSSARHEYYVERKTYKGVYILPWDKEIRHKVEYDYDEYTCIHCWKRMEKNKKYKHWGI